MKQIYLTMIKPDQKLYHLNKTNGKFDHGPKMVWFGFEASVTIHQDLDCLGCFREDLELVWYGLI